MTSDDERAKEEVEKEFDEIESSFGYRLGKVRSLVTSRLILVLARRGQSHFNFYQEIRGRPTPPQSAIHKGLFSYEKGRVLQSYLRLQ